MVTPAPDLERLFEFESQLETGFVTLFSNAVINAFSSRGAETLNTPYVALYCTAGAVLQNHMAFKGNTITPYDWFEGGMVTKIVTNRVTDNAELPPQHTVYLGKMRKALLLPFVRAGSALCQWPSDNYLQLADIRQDSTIDTYTDEDGLDTTEISWYLNFQIKPDAWPPTFA